MQSSVGGIGALFLNLDFSLVAIVAADGEAAFAEPLTSDELQGWEEGSEWAVVEVSAEDEVDAAATKALGSMYLPLFHQVMQGIKSRSLRIPIRLRPMLDGQ